jgi:predicted transcriptional regulator
MNKVLKVGIATVPEQRARSLAIAAGTRLWSDHEPNVWFPSIAAMARVLSDENMALLKAVREQRPDSMDTLAKSVGKLAPNVSRSLHAMADYGLVRFVKNGRAVVPEATFEHLSVDVC